MKLNYFLCVFGALIFCNPTMAEDYSSLMTCYARVPLFSDAMVGVNVGSEGGDSINSVTTLSNDKSYFITMTATDLYKTPTKALIPEGAQKLAAVNPALAPFIYQDIYPYVSELRGAGLVNNLPYLYQNKFLDEPQRFEIPFLFRHQSYNLVGRKTAEDFDIDHVSSWLQKHRDDGVARITESDLMIDSVQIKSAEMIFTNELQNWFKFANSKAKEGLHNHNEVNEGEFQAMMRYIFCSCLETPFRSQVKAFLQTFVDSGVSVLKNLETGKLRPVQKSDLECVAG